MDVNLLVLTDERELLNTNQIVEIVKMIANFIHKPKEDHFKQIEYISKLEKLITQDENGDYVVEKIFHNNTGCIQALLKFIAICDNPHVVLRSLSLIHKCLFQKRSLKGTISRRNSTSIIFDEGQVLINILLNIEDQLEYVSCTQKLFNSIYYYLLSILNIGCKRDKRFCRYFDKFHVLRKLMYLLGRYERSLKVSAILMDIFKCILKTRNANEFITNKLFFDNLETIFTILKNKRSPKIKTMVFLIKFLAKNENIHESIFETKIINYLLSILVNDDNLPISYSIYKSIVLSINKIIKNDLFLEYFKTNTNIRLLYRFCSHFVVSEEKHHIILLKVCSIIHACLMKRVLLTESGNCYYYPLPNCNQTSIESLNVLQEDFNAVSDESDVEDEDDDELDEDEEDGNDENLILNNNDDQYTNYHERNTIQQQDSATTLNQTLFKTSTNLYPSLKEYSQEGKGCKIKIFENFESNSKSNSVYCTLASRVCTKRQFVKVAYPDMIGAEAVLQPQYLITNYSKNSKIKLLEMIDRAVNEKPQNPYQIIYDLDFLQANETTTNCVQLKCDDVYNLTNSNICNSSSLKFESRFEGGNLRKAYKVNQQTYNLILAPDVNTNRKYQWFYFEVSNMKSQMPYVFNIINCDKSNTQYNHGMQPVLFSVRDAMLGKIGWVRTGTDIFYYRNNYTNFTQPSTVYHTLSFTIRFTHGNDICYIAYHYPYTYTRLMKYLFSLVTNPVNNVYLSVDTFCYTLANNAVPLVTITAPITNHNLVHKRKVVVLTSRVHPAESNASWAIEGTIRYLMQDEPAVRQLRDEYIFKIVPMQNPDGVIYGSYRCGLTTEDLNRCWQNPDIVRHPEVFHVKAMVQQLIQKYKRPISLYIDYHGHSRKKNFFLYGCSNKSSWKKSDRCSIDHIEEYMHYPTVLGDSTKSLSLKSCKFNVEKNRESTARVTVWREFGVKCSYTVECTYCGFDIGPYKTQTINTKHLFEIGASLMRTLWLITSEAKRNKLILPYLCINCKETIVVVDVPDENSDVMDNK